VAYFRHILLYTGCIIVGSGVVFIPGYIANRKFGQLDIWGYLVE
jgi:hypothetical protein